MCDFDSVSHVTNRKVLSNNKRFKSSVEPEIYKNRPVIVLFIHGRMRSAIVVPLTSVTPTIDSLKTVHIPKGTICGALAKKDSWALCDMPITVSFARLCPVYSGDKAEPFIDLNSAEAKLGLFYFNQIKENLRNIFAS